MVVSPSHTNLIMFCLVTPQLAKGKHCLSTTTSNYTMALYFQTGIKRRKVKNISSSAQYNTVITQELNYELSLQHKKA
jgi:hypothetical protein